MLEHIGFWSLIPIFEEKKKKQKDKLKASDLLILFF